MDSLTLSYDSEMNLSKAEEYFKDNTPFGAFKNGSKLDTYTSIEKDGAGNTVFIQCEKETQTKTGRITKLYEEVLEYAAKLIDKNTELIAQIEYAVRNIPMNRSKSELKLGTNYLLYFGRMVNMLKSFPHVMNMYPENRTPEIVYFFDDQPIWELLYKLGVILASGLDVVLYVSVNVAAVCLLIVNNFLTAGLLADTLTMYVCEMKNVRSLEDGVVFAVFDSCDLDSAVDSVVKSLHPFNYTTRVKQIYVQESISKIFIKKLEDRAARLDAILYKNVKKTVANTFMLNNLKSIFDFINSHQIDFIKLYSSNEKDSNKFASVILLDSCLKDNVWKDVVKETYCLPVAGLQTFRTTKEALNLINNFSSFGLSLWCDRNSIIDEVVFTVDSNYIWVNSCGKINSTCGWNLGLKFKNIYRGGVLDLQRVLFDSRFKRIQSNVPDNSSSQTYKAEAEKAFKLQQQWKRLDCDAKSMVLLNIAESFKSLEGSFSSGVLQESLKKIIAYLNFAVVLCNEAKNNVNMIDANNVCLELSQPIGVIFIESPTEILEYAINAIIAPVVYGNAVVASVHNKEIVKLCKIMINAGLPIVIVEPQPTSRVNIDIVNGFWYISNTLKEPSLNELPSHRFILQTPISDFNTLITSKELLEARFMRRKIIWKTFGETFAT